MEKELIFKMIRMGMSRSYCSYYQDIIVQIEISGIRTTTRTTVADVTQNTALFSMFLFLQLLNLRTISEIEVTVFTDDTIILSERMVHNLTVTRLQIYTDKLENVLQTVRPPKDAFRFRGGFSSETNTYLD